MEINVKKFIPGIISIVVAIVLFIVSGLDSIVLVGKWVEKDSETVDYIKELLDRHGDNFDRDERKAMKEKYDKIENGYEFGLFGSGKAFNNLAEFDEFEELAEYGLYIPEEGKNPFKYKFEDKALYIEYEDEDLGEYDLDYKISNGKTIKFKDVDAKQYGDTKYEKKGFLGFITLSGTIWFVGLVLVLLGAYLIVRIFLKPKTGAGTGYTPLVNPAGLNK